MQNNESNLVWMDLEMSGLNPDHDVILEIATIITDAQLNILEEGPVFAIHQSDDILESMDEWNTKHHAQSGLTERVRNSTINITDAELQTLEFIRRYVPKNKSPLCGNSICQDRRFLYRYMPTLENYLHYRHLDVSSLKILAQLWNPRLLQGIKKESSHIALEDIRDSINELRYYKQHMITIKE